MSAPIEKALLGKINCRFCQWLGSHIIQVTLFGLLQMILLFMFPLGLMAISDGGSHIEHILIFLVLFLGIELIGLQLLYKNRGCTR